MVDFLRRFQQPVLITLTVVVIIAFVILYGGPGTRLDRLGSQHVATIYGRRIQPADYQAVGRGFEVCRTLGMLDLIIPLAQNARTMDEVANNFVWNTLVLRHAAEELGIQPGEEQIAGAIKKLNVFQKNGQYDHERYLQAMQSFLNPRGMTSAHLEELVRDQIRMQTVRDLLSANADPAPDEIEAAYAERHQKVEAAFVRIPREDVAKTITVPDDEVQKAYEARKETLKTREKRSVHHAFFPLPAREKDAAPAAEAMQKVADKAADFALAAVSDPAGFAEAAKKFETEVKTTPVFALGEPVEDFAKMPQVSRAAFQLTKEKPVSDPLPTEKGYFVLRLDKLEEARAQTFEEAKENLLKSLKEDRVRETLALKAAEVRKKIEEGLKGGKSFVQAAEAAGLKAETPEPFSRSDSKPGPETGLLQNAVSSLKPAETSQPVDGPEGTLLVHLINRQPIDRADLEQKKTEFLPMLKNMKAENLLVEWMDRQRAASGLRFVQSAR